MLLVLKRYEADSLAGEMVQLNTRAPARNDELKDVVSVHVQTHGARKKRCRFFLRNEMQEQNLSIRCCLRRSGRFRHHVRGEYGGILQSP